MSDIQRQAIDIAVARLEAVYAKLPALECRQLCQRETCIKPQISRPEFDRVIERWGYKPKSTADGVCPMLHHSRGTCRLYAIRPLICRLTGVIEKMQCPYGCRPERPITMEEARALINEVAEIEREYIAAVDGVGECDAEGPADTVS